MEPAALKDLLTGLDVRSVSAGATHATVTGICIDSRKVQPGDLFFALKGEKSDGHLYVGQALERGAVAAVVSEEPSPAAEGPLVLVEDALRFLGETARNYRRRFAIPVVAITGSVGKTSVKEMTADVLRTTHVTHISEKNYNNEIGVPLTLFGLNGEHRAAVVEMGMRAAGEIAWLAEVAEPTIGLITNIGHAHLELLGSREAIALAKAELIERLPAGGTAIVPRHDAFYELLRSRVPAHVEVVTFSDNPALPADVTTHDGPGYYLATVRGERYKATLKAVGEHHFRNAAAALAVALTLNIPIPAALDALAEWSGAEGRAAVRRLPAGITILDDCYNAGPESMESALATLMRMTNGGGVAVLGDMRELGPDAPELHRRLGAAVVAARPRLLVTVGELAQHIAAAADAALRELRDKYAVDYRMVTLHCSDSEAAAGEIRRHVCPGDTVLVKGSRAMEMEKIVSAIAGVYASVEGPDGRAPVHG